jgi:hypothetical protein
METLVIGGALLGSFVGAFVIQKAALEGLFRILRAERRLRREPAGRAVSGAARTPWMLRQGSAADPSLNHGCEPVMRRTRRACPGAR